MLPYNTGYRGPITITVARSEVVVAHLLDTVAITDTDATATADTIDVVITDGIDVVGGRSAIVVVARGRLLN